MKMNTLEKLRACMEEQSPELIMDAGLIERARRPIERMLELSK